MDESQLEKELSDVAKEIGISVDEAWEQFESRKEKLSDEIAADVDEHFLSCAALGSLQARVIAERMTDQCPDGGCRNGE